MGEPAEVGYLRCAFRESGLWRRGWTFARALGAAEVRKALELQARAMQRADEQRTGKPAPMQPALL